MPENFTAHDQFQQAAELMEAAFKLFDQKGGPIQRDRERATLMVQAAGASATLLAAREQRMANLIALASVPEELGANMDLRREAFQQVAEALGLVEDEPGMTPGQFDDLMEDDPADMDVEK
jgi:hypothetical protein